MRPTKTVVDSSVIVKWISQQGEKNIEQADRVLKDVEEGKIEVYAPELAKYEVANALLSGKQLSPFDAKVSLGTVYSLPIQFVPETFELAQQAYQFGYKFGITYYDSTFVSLTDFLQGQLVTDNPKHQAKVKDIKVVALKDYK